MYLGNCSFYVFGYEGLYHYSDAEADEYFGFYYVVLVNLWKHNEILLIYDPFYCDEGRGDAKFASLFYGESFLVVFHAFQYYDPG